MQNGERITKKPMPVMGKLPNGTSQVVFSDDDTSGKQSDQYQSLLDIIVRCQTPQVINYSPPRQPNMFVASVECSGLDCRGRDMSLIADAATK
jgi:hypothetical protein